MNTGIKKEKAPAAYPLMKRPVSSIGIFTKHEITDPIIEMAWNKIKPLTRLNFVKQCAVSAPRKAPICGTVLTRVLKGSFS